MGIAFEAAGHDSGALLQGVQTALAHTARSGEEAAVDAVLQAVGHDEAIAAFDVVRAWECSCMCVAEDVEMRVRATAVRN